MDVVVVGGGSSGSVVARRLADRGADVLLIEAGPGLARPTERRASVVAPSATDDRAATHSVELTAQRRENVVRGRGLGGSSVVNGGNFCWPTPADTDDWAVAGWTYDDVAARLRRSIIPTRLPQGRLLTEAGQRFLDAATTLGLPAEPDKNAAGVPGAGPVPTNVLDGVRVDAATAYLVDRPTNLQVRTQATVHELRFDTTSRPTVVGVKLSDGTTVDADRVVLSAGALITPYLLLRAGIGPSALLTQHSLPVMADLPVGERAHDHPAVFVPYLSDAATPHPHASSSPVSVEVVSSTPARPAVDPLRTDLQILGFVRPFTPAGPAHLMCTLTDPLSRGVLDLHPESRDDPRVRLRYRYLADQQDRQRMREAVRLGVRLITNGLGALPPDALQSGTAIEHDAMLDSWIAEHLTSAVHLCGTAPLGQVVDSHLAVHGVAGLYLADTSVLPTAPRRGPWAAAVAIGEYAGELIG